MKKVGFEYIDPTGKKTKGEIDAVSVQALQRGTDVEPFLGDFDRQMDGKFDLIAQDASGELNHIIACNTDRGAQLVHTLFKTNVGKPIRITVGEQSFTLINMDDGAGNEQGPTSGEMEDEVE